MSNEAHKLYLSGGGNEQQSAPLDKLFFASLPENGSLLYIPVALRGHRLFEGASAWLRAVVDTHGRPDIKLNTLDELNEMSSEQVLSHDAIYIGGGNTWLLMKELVDSGFDTVVRTFAAQKGPVYGGSAGAIVLGRYIDTHKDENTAHWDRTDGLDLLSTFSVACHTTSEELPRYEAWVHERITPLFCIPEEAGVVFDGTQFLNAGSANITLINKDGVATQVKPSEAFQI